MFKSLLEMSFGGQKPYQRSLQDLSGPGINFFSLGPLSLACLLWPVVLHAAFTVCTGWITDILTTKKSLSAVYNIQGYKLGNLEIILLLHTLFFVVAGNPQLFCNALLFNLY